jgi:hypothetical protein
VRSRSSDGEKTVVDNLGVHGFDVRPGLHSHTVSAAPVSAEPSTAIETSATIVARLARSAWRRS